MIARLVALLLVALLGAAHSASALVSTSRACVARAHRSAVRPSSRVFCMAAADEDAASEVAADSDADGEADGEATGDDDAPAEDGDGLLNSPAFLKKKIEVLEDELSKMTAERDELAAKLEDEANSPMVLRLQADFENLRRRTTEQMAETRDMATVDAIKQLLPVIDNFDRAGQLKLASEDAIGVQNSYQQLYKQMLEVITKNLGAAEIEAEGKEFDFNLHEAITRQPSEDVPENHVMTVLQRGFAIGDKLVRPAGVMVSMGSPSGSADSKE